MKKLFVSLLGLFCLAGAKGQTTINIVSGTQIVGVGPIKAVVAAGTFSNTGIYTDVSGTFIVKGGVDFNGTGTNTFNDLIINHASEVTLLNTTVSVVNNTTITAGTVNVGSEQLYLRTDINPTADLVNNGVLMGTVKGLVTNATASSGGCPSFTSVLSTNVSGSVMQYQWQSSSDSSLWINVVGATNATYTPTVTTTSFYRCVLSTSNSSYLQSTPGKKLTLIDLTPSAISGTFTICPAVTITLGNTISGGIWSSSNPSVGSIGAASGILTGVAAGTTIITYNTGCGTPATKVVTVNPLPVAGVVSGITTLSAGTTTILTATPSGGTWFSASGTIASINASTGLVTGSAVGVATVSYTRTNSCGSTVTTVAVTVTAAITPITGVRVVCQGATTNLANATAGGTWSTANGAIATVGTTGVVTGVSGGTTTITYAFSGGGNLIATITVNAAPAVYTGSGFVCTGSQLNLGSVISGCTWTSGNTARATVANITGIVTGGTTLGTVNITYTNAATCRTIAQLTVNTGVALITGVTSPCLGNSITLANATSGGTWSSSNTARATIDASTGVLTAVGGGTATISYTLSSGCRRTTIVTVGTPPVITGNPSLCLGQQNLLVSSGGTWSSSNATIAAVAPNGMVTGMGLGNAVITYRSTANTLCFVTQTVTVNPVSSIIAGPTAMCPGETATLTSSPAGGTWTSTYPEKASVDPLTGVVTAFIFNFSTISCVNIIYTLPNGCGRLATVTINPLPSPIGGNSSICVAGTTTLTNSSVGCTWSSASPSIATAAAGGIITGVSAGLATISYTNALGCAHTKVVTVNAVPGVNTGSATLCLPGGSTTLSNPAGAGTWTSSNTTKAIVNFSTGVVTGVNTGTSNITYSKGAGCISVTQVTVNMCSARPGMTEDKEGGNNTFSVSPNPTTGAFNLTTSILGKVEIYTIDGKELQQYDAKEGTTNISLPAGIASGVYLLRFNGADGSSKMVRLVYQQ